MDFFEYLIVMVSIILGLGATQTLRGLSKIARSAKRFLPVTIWAVTVFWLHIQVWWGLWDLSGVDDWNQFKFYLLMAIPCSIFAASELLMPFGSSPETDWREHFFSVHKTYFVVFFFFILMAIFNTKVLLDTPLTHPYRIIQITALGLTAVGFFAKTARAHVWISVLFIADLMVGQFLFRLLPGLSQ